MSNSIWVLVINECDAAICASEEGVSRLLRVIAPSEATRHYTGGRQRAFALQLMSELFQGAKRMAYDGVVIIAAQDMLEELRRVTLPEIRKLLVAEICGAERAGLLPAWSAP